MSFSIGIGPNIRKSPYFDATVADGVQSFSVYNHMYLPAHFGTAGAGSVGRQLPEGNCRHLDMDVNAVQQRAAYLRPVALYLRR